MAEQEEGAKRESIQKETATEQPNVVVEDDSNRAEFSNHCEYFLSSLGLAVGLGNIWRFPYKCYENGGGTFLFPYLLCLFLCGLPLLFMEMALGQYAGLSSTKIFAQISPGLKGMGYGMVIIPTLINFYYTVVMAYALYFLFTGFTANEKLPWGLCDNDYNSQNCYSLLQAKACNVNETFFNKGCMNVTDFCEDHGLDFEPENNTHCFDSNGDATHMRDIELRVSPSEEYWYLHTLNLNVNFTQMGTHLVIEGEDATSWEHWGAPNWKIIGCLFLAWTLVCLALIKGVQSYGKVVYFTTLFPYVVLTTLLAYAATLEGFTDGLEFYLVPDWDKITDLDVWKNAATQIFYSLGVAVGSQLLLSSYNPFKTNCHRDTLIIGICNSLTSIYAGTVVFGVLGYMAAQKGVSVADVIDSGPALTFVVYPEAVSVMNPGPLFSFLFFFMLNLLALSSICGAWEAQIAAIMDEFPSLRSKRVIVMVVSCFIAFLCGVPMCFESGFLLLSMMDNRTGNAIALMAFVELAIIAWFYGIDAFMEHIDDMEMKVPKFMRIFWRTCWQVITPLIIGFITIMGYAGHEDEKSFDYTYPAGVQALGWMIELSAVAIVILYSANYVFRKYRQGNDIRFLTPGPMMTPKDTWGPRPDSGLAKVKQDHGIDNPIYVS